MIRVWKFAILCAAVSNFAQAQAQAPLSVSYQKSAQVLITGATAAYSLDASIVEASAANGVVEITGKAPGTTSVVVVTAAGVQTISVTVPAPKPVLPPGFDAPHNEAMGESGNYEVRYNSDPRQISNALDMKRAQGQSFERLQLVNANLLSAGSSTSTVGFPLLSYEIGRPNSDVTFLDQNVAHSPLTLDSYLVRGFHMREGPWEFHGGETSIAMFQGLFLNTDPEYAAGVSRLFRLDENASFEGNFYYFRNPASAQLVSSNGAVGSLVYRIKRGDRLRFLAELGASRGMGFAMRGTYDTKITHAIGSFRTESRNFASLAVNPQHGTFATVDASRQFSPRLALNYDLSQSDFNLAALQQNTLTTSGQLNFKVNSNVSVNGGVARSSFESVVPLSGKISTVNLPLGLDYSARHFGTGFQYQRTMTSDASGGNDYAMNARASAGQFRAGVFFRHDVQVPTVSVILSQIPGLQDALERAGIVATTPDQLAALLNNTALLASLGFITPLTVNLAPARNDLEGTFTWMSRGYARRQVDVTYFKSNTELVQGKFVLSTATVSYGQRLGVNNNIVASAAMVQTDSNGVSSTKPLISVSLQHRFFSVPGMLFPGRHGVIEGHVFRDDDSRSLLSGQPGIAGVEVRLDDERVTHSDANGYYSFHHVPFGVHRVEAKYQSQNDAPFFYTTDSPAMADINTTVDFGINFAKGQVFGFLVNDAGAGVGGITVELVEIADANDRQLPRETLVRREQTGGNGKFSFTGLTWGTYAISTLPDSYPSGYSLQALAAQTVTVGVGKPVSLQFEVKALRSVAGRVLVYDPSSLQTIPVPGAVVRLKELALEIHTGANGAYIFRNLPAGTYTLAVEHAGKETTRSVTLPKEPASLRDLDLNVTNK